MVRFRGGIRKKSRHKFQKNYREKGKISLRAFFRKFIPGDKVVLKANTAHQGGMYASRFHGKAGVIGEKKGSCYYVSINDGNKSKKLIVHPVHLKAQ